MTKWHGGKGSGRRVEDKKKIDANWDAIFGKKHHKELNEKIDELFKDYVEEKELEYRDEN